MTETHRSETSQTAEASTAPTTAEPTVRRGQVKTLAEHIASAAVARANCVRGGNAEWQARWTDRLAELADLLPSGSGIDSGTTIGDCDKRTIRLSAPFHHLDEHGYYDGWTTYQIHASASLIGGLSVSVRGRDRNGTKDYLAELYECQLTRRYVEVYDPATETSTYEAVED